MTAVGRAQPTANLYHAKTPVFISSDTGVCSIGVRHATKPGQATLRLTMESVASTPHLVFTDILQNGNTALTSGPDNGTESVESEYRLKQGGAQCFA
jgi:hypothetical protein